MQRSLNIYRTRRGRSTRRGMAFALTMMALFVALCIILIGSFATGGSRGSGLLSETSNSTQMANRSLNETAAFNLAESGVEYTMQWLHEKSSPPVNTTPFRPDFSAWNGNSGVAITGGREVVTMPVDPAAGSTGTFSVLIYPDTQTQNGYRYLIESIGTYNGVQQIVTAYVGQQSFGHYAYFTDMEVSNGYWDTLLNTFDGPMHSNNANGSDTPGTVPTNIIWHNASSATPMFTYTGNDAFTSSASTISWNMNSIGNMTSPSSTSDWSHVAAGGAGSVKTGVPAVPLPTSSSLQQNAALGGTSAPSGTAPSVTIPNSSGNTAGGIYIHGTVSEMSFSVTNSVVQNIQITQSQASPAATVVTTVTLDPTQGSSGTTTVTTVTSPTPTQSNPNPTPTTTTSSYSGTTNGVVYSDSTIGTSSSGGVHGSIADNYYDTSGNLVHSNGVAIVTDASKNLYFDGSLTTNTQRAKDSSGNYLPESQDSNYTSKAGTLGIVSNTIEVIDKDYNGNAITNFEVDGSVLAYNTFDCTNYSSRTKGKFQLVGGYIAKSGGIFGSIDNNGNLLNGLAEHYNYDARLSTNPPPFFPTTGSNYDILSWARVASTVQ